MKNYLVSVLLLFLYYPTFSQEEEKLNQMINEFESITPDLSLPVLQLEYIPLLEQSQNIQVVNRQKQYFSNLENQLQNMNHSDLSRDSKLDYQLLKFTAELHLQRIAILETAAQLNEPISEEGVANLSYGKEYYRFLLKLWTGTRMSPEQIMELGHREVEKVKNEIKKIQGEREDEEFYSFLDSDDFLITDEKELILLFEDRKKQVNESMFAIFPNQDSLPDVAISKNNNRRFDHVPGYYNHNTFYYTLFETPFNRRKIDWLFIHEANPGHHFQISFENTLDLPDYRSMIASPGYREGWAAYIEELGHQFGVYQDQYAYLGKWEWDLVRSVRVVLDVGMNYYGWSKDRALDYWKKHIVHNDQIALREINRMIRWPAQIHTYKVGAYLIMKKKAEIMELQGEDFNEVEFHKTYLNYGSIPLEFIDLIYLAED